MVLSVVTRGMIDPSVMRTLLASHSCDFSAVRGNFHGERASDLE